MNKLDKKRLCGECRKGPGYRLDLVHVKGELYRCPACGSTWKLVGGASERGTD